MINITDSIQRDHRPRKIELLFLRQNEGRTTQCSKPVLECCKSVRDISYVPVNSSLFLILIGNLEVVIEHLFCECIVVIVNLIKWNFLLLRYVVDRERVRFTRV